MVSYKFNICQNFEGSYTKKSSSTSHIGKTNFEFSNLNINQY